MILYTTVPLEQLYPTDQSDFQKQLTIPCEAGSLMVEQQGDGDYRIIRLLSSDPHAYLNPAYEPGTILSSTLRY
ncbi:MULTISPECIES: YlzJ-like family protein [Shouchella]|uniref:YlzJ-like family protein n=2 Tax=Shouchella TaxID=2893057 RepID=A0ABY7W882_9BACI|nr:MULTISPECIES: YlzJ-like family protein [Shouchella]MED4127240.1 YlzJ-like family protein [Shouchella miscanthi]WDF03718.1 YlzJ-like family protein [Shouchella hunanensis]GAF23541.1 hypothetical protein JCM19047_3369 [Bacillus sp. JCM 19047]